MMHQHTSVPYYSVPLGAFCFELYDMYSYGRYGYDDPQRIRMICTPTGDMNMMTHKGYVHVYIYIYIYIYEPNKHENG